MPGYEMRTNEYGDRSLGLGRRRPTPSAVPEGGFGNMNANHPLAIKAAQDRAMRAQQTAHAVGLMAPPAAGPSPHEVAMMNYGRSGPMPVGARSNLHAFGDTGPGTQDLYGVSGAAFNQHAQASNAGRQQLEYDNDNAMVNARLHQGDLRAGRQPGPYQPLVRGSSPTPPGSAGPSPMTPGGLLAGIPTPRPPAVRVPTPTAPMATGPAHSPSPSGMGAMADALMAPGPAPPIPMGTGVTPEKMAGLPMQQRSRGPATPAASRINMALRQQAPAGAPGAAPGGGDPIFEAHLRWANAQTDPAWRQIGVAAAHESRAAREQEAQANTVKQRIDLAQAAQIEEQNKQLAQSTRLSPTGRQIVAGVGAGLYSPQQGREEELRSQNAAAQPSIPPSSPTYDQAAAFLFGPKGAMGNDPSRLFPAEGGSALDAYDKARQFGYDLSNPDSPLSNHYQAYIKGHFGEQQYRGAGADPSHWYGPATTEEQARAAWFRDQLMAQGAPQASRAPQAPQAPPRERPTIPLIPPLFDPREQWKAAQWLWKNGPTIRL